MAFEVQEGYVFLNKDLGTGMLVVDEDLKRLFWPEWMSDLLANADPEAGRKFEQTYWDQVNTTLKQISAGAQNWTDHGVPVAQSKLKIGNKSIPVKQLLLTGFAYSLPIYVAAVEQPAIFSRRYFGQVLGTERAAAIGCSYWKRRAVRRVQSTSTMEFYSGCRFGEYEAGALTLQQLRDQWTPGVCGGTGGR